MATPAVRWWSRSAQALGIPFPRHDAPLSASESPFACVFVNFGSSPLAIGTLKAYAFHASKFIRFLVLAPSANASSHEVTNLLASRMMRWTPGRFDSRPAFHRSLVSSVVNDTSLPLAMRAACALAWDTVARLGAILQVHSTSSRTPMPRSNLSVHAAGPLITAELRIFDKGNKSWIRLTTTSDPSSPFFHPARVGAAELLLMLWGTTTGHNLWSTPSGPCITAKAMADTVASKSSTPIHITGHCFRVSSASWLIHHKLASKDALCILGRWQNPASITPYIRHICNP